MFHYEYIWSIFPRIDILLLNVFCSIWQCMCSLKRQNGASQYRKLQVSPTAVVLNFTKEGEGH